MKTFRLKITIREGVPVTSKARFLLRGTLPGQRRVQEYYPTRFAAEQRKTELEAEGYLEAQKQALSLEIPKTVALLDAQKIARKARHSAHNARKAVISSITEYKGLLTFTIPQFEEKGLEWSQKIQKSKQNALDRIKTLQRKALIAEEEADEADLACIALW